MCCRAGRWRKSQLPDNHTSPFTMRQTIIDLQASRIRDVANAGLGRSDVLAFWFGESDVIRIWNTALSNDDSNLPKWIQEMPVEYSPIWESLTTDEKNRIVAQSKMYRLDTPYQIRNFWSTRGLESAKGRTTSLNESNSNFGGGFTNSDLGYDTDFVNNIASQLASRFNR